MPKSMLRIAAFLFIASCAAVMDYGPRELTIRREMKFPGRTKSELYAQSMEFALGEMGLATFRVAYHSKGDGKLIVRGSVNENVSGFYNDSIAVTFDVSVEKGKASAAISNPIMESRGGLFGEKQSPINMPEEYEAYKNMANGIFDNFERYVRDNKPPKESNPGAADAMGWGWQ